MYKVIYPFADLQDGNKIYLVGDVYPHAGVSDERIAELAGSANKIGKPLIEAVNEAKKSADTGDKKPKSSKSSSRAKKSPKKAKKE